MDAKKTWALVLMLAVSLSAAALEVDERLTLRVLKVSETRKTLLINRGSEDGLAEGDHAKFFVSSGVVVRAVALKVSPSRSVWAAYRLVNADLVVPDAVMTLKIAPPVKLTQDETKMVEAEDTPTQVTTENAPSLGIPLAEGANDLPAGTAVVDATSQADLAALNAAPSSLRESNMEIWGALNYSALSTKSTGEEPEQDYSGNSTPTQFAVGGEYYSKQEGAWWARFSPYAFLASQRGGGISYEGTTQDDAVTEFGGGLNWHPWTAPWTANTFMPFLGAGFGMGTVQSSRELAGTTNEAKGSSFSTHFGAGFKFYTANGFGARAVLDYYMRNDKLKEDITEASWDRSTSGPRLWVGLGYRF